MRDEAFYNRVSSDRLSTRQVDELIGLARGICADGVINQAEVEYLEKWLAGNLHITGQPLIQTLFERVRAALSDGEVTPDEQRDLFDTLKSFGASDIECGEALKATTLPLCDPPPDITFRSKRYTFTGTFQFGTRRTCEAEVLARGGECGSLTRQTNYLVIGVYATDSWKHSSFGNKILGACDMREEGVPISIVAEQHWRTGL